MQAGSALHDTVNFSNRLKNTPLKLLIWKEGFTNFPKKNELLSIFSSVKPGYRKAGNTEMEKLQNLYYEQNIFFQKTQRFLKLTKLLFPYSEVCSLHLNTQIQDS